MRLKVTFAVLAIVALVASACVAEEPIRRATPTFARSSTIEPPPTRTAPPSPVSTNESVRTAVKSPTSAASPTAVEVAERSSTIEPPPMRTAPSSPVSKDESVRTTVKSPTSVASPTAVETIERSSTIESPTIAVTPPTAVPSDEPAAKSEPERIDPVLYPSNTSTVEKLTSNGPYSEFELFWSGGPPDIGFTSLEERVLSSDIVLHAKLRSAKAAGQCEDEDLWQPLIQYEFEVIEYVKGKGEAIVYVNVPIYRRSNYSETTPFYGYENEAITAAAIKFFSEDRRWDDVEALIFLSGDHDQSKGCRSAHIERDNTFTFTMVRQFPDFQLTSLNNRTWLPRIKAEWVTEKVEFHLSDPEVDDESVEETRIDLELIRRIDNELTEFKSKPDGISDNEYAGCLKAKHSRSRINEQLIKDGWFYAYGRYVHERHESRILFDIAPRGVDLGNGWGKEFIRREGKSDKYSILLDGY